MTSNKRECRRQLTESWNSLSEKTLSRLSKTTFLTITESREWKRSKTVLAYLAFGTELDLDELILTALKEGKEVYVPRIADGNMKFLQLFNLDEQDLYLNRWGIREPSPSNPEFNHKTEENTLMLVPGLGFTREGIRMGRGGGYYDRYLEKNGDLTNLITMGICWSAVLRKHLPSESHDRRVEFLCCEDRLIRTQSLN